MDRIAAVLRGEASSEAIGAMIAEAEAEVRRLSNEREATRKLSLDPMSLGDIVAEARQHASALEFEIERLLRPSTTFAPPLIKLVNAKNRPKPMPCARR